jgi:hypothetical protein
LIVVIDDNDRRRAAGFESLVQATGDDGGIIVGRGWDPAGILEQSINELVSG